MAARTSGPVERATRSELRRLKFSALTVADAALAVSLAWQIDRAKGAVAAAAAGKQLTDIMDKLRQRAADERPERSVIDQLRERRSAKDGSPAATG